MCHVNAHRQPNIVYTQNTCMCVRAGTSNQITESDAIDFIVHCCISFRIVRSVHTIRVHYWSNFGEKNHRVVAFFVCCKALNEWEVTSSILSHFVLNCGKNYEIGQLERNQVQQQNSPQKSIARNLLWNKSLPIYWLPITRSFKRWVLFWEPIATKNVPNFLRWIDDFVDRNLHVNQRQRDA